MEQLVNVAHTLRKAYDLLFAQEGTLAERLEQVEETLGSIPAVRSLIDFVGADTSRGMLTPKG